jgi:hypothetical protein
MTWPMPMDIAIDYGQLAIGYGYMARLLIVWIGLGLAF